METDLYYRISHGLSSKLLKYENGIFFLEVTVGRKWNKNHNATAAEIAHAWKINNNELEHAIGCKVYIIDLRLDISKTTLIKSGINPGYDAFKGILFRKNYLN